MQNGWQKVDEEDRNRRERRCKSYKKEIARIRRRGWKGIAIGWHDGKEDIQLGG
jgi:hypothetical protein